MFARRFFNSCLQLRLHQARGLFRHQRIQFDAVDQVQRVQDIAFGLGHLLAFGIPHQAGDIDLPERHVAHELQSHHDHPGDPEENDVETGNQDAGGVKPFEFPGLFRPAQRGEGPQRRGKPGIEHVRVPGQFHGVTQPVFFPDVGLVPADVNIAAGVVPGRDAVPPPQLARDAPVVDVAHPLEVGLGPVLRDEADITVFHGGDGRVGQGLDFYVPLVGEVRFDHCAGTVAARDHQGVVLDFLHQIQGFKVLDHLPARIIAVHSPVCGRAVFINHGVNSEDIQQWQVVALPHFIVIEIMGRRDLDAAGAELRVHVVVGYHRDGAVRQGQFHCLPHQFPVTLVVRVYRHRSVAQHGFGTRRGHHQTAVAVAARVADVPEMPFFLFGQHLQVGDGRVQHRVPVHQPLAAVDEALVVQADKHFLHRMGKPFVHGETLPAPVHGRAQAP